MVATKSPKNSNSTRNNPPAFQSPTDGMYRDDLPLWEICAWEKNPRKQFEEAGLLDLVESIRHHGIQQPIVVRYLPGRMAPYQIVMGERRFRAATMLGLETMPARIRVDLSDADAMVLAVTENCQRKDLSAIEEAASFQALIDEGKTQQEVGDLLGIPQSTVANRLRLLTLPEDVRGLVSEGKLAPSHAKALLRFSKFPAALSHMAALAVARGTPSKELETGMPFAGDLRQKKLLMPLDYNAKFPREGCKACPHGAYFTGGDWPQQWCLRPDQYMIKDKAARDVEAEVLRVTLEQAKAQSDKAQERLARLGVETPGVPPPAGASPVQDAQTANAVKKAEATLPKLHNFAYNTYVTIPRDFPPGCSEECACRILAMNGLDMPVPVCMKPSRYNQLKGEETKAKRVILKERFDRDRGCVLNLEEPGAAGDATAMAVYHRVLAVALTKALWSLGAKQRAEAVRQWRYLDDADLVRLLGQEYYHVKDSDVWPVLARQPLHALQQLALELYVGEELSRGLECVNETTPLLDFFLDRQPAPEKAPAEVLKIVVDPPYKALSESDKDRLYSEYSGDQENDCHCERCKDFIPAGDLGYPFTEEAKARNTKLLRLSNGILVIERDEFEFVYCRDCAAEEAICRVCGCTEHVPCEDGESGETCAWYEKDLCTECVGEETEQSVEEPE